MLNRILLAASAASPEGLQKADEYCWSQFMRADLTPALVRYYLETHMFLERVRKERV